MKNNYNKNAQTPVSDSQTGFDSYIKKLDNQELKGMLLKLKNEIRKPDPSWGVISNILKSLKQKNTQMLTEVITRIVD